MNLLVLLFSFFFVVTVIAESGDYDSELENSVTKMFIDDKGNVLTSVNKLPFRKECHISFISKFMINDYFFLLDKFNLYFYSTAVLDHVNCKRYEQTKQKKFLDKTICHTKYRLTSS